jgi:hypothetical protein
MSGEAVTPESDPSASEPAPAAPATPAATAVPASSSSMTLDSGRSWQAGPVLSTGLLQPWVVRGEYHQDRTWSAGLGFGTYTYSTSSGEVDDISVSLRQIEVLGSWFPWQSAFYVNGGLGQQVISAEATSKQKVQSAASGGEELSLTGSYDITSTYLFAGVGWLWRLTQNFVLGTGFGLHLPIASSAEFDATLADSEVLNEAVKKTNAYKEFESATEDAGKAAGRLALPKLELLRIGYLF